MGAASTGLGRRAKSGRTESPDMLELILVLSDIHAYPQDMGHAYWQAWRDHVSLDGWLPTGVRGPSWRFFLGCPLQAS